MVDLRTEKKHNSKRDIRSREIIEDIQSIDLNQGLLNQRFISSFFR